MTDRSPNAVEREFLVDLASRCEGIHDWYHADADGTPWMTVSLDVVEGDWVVRTWRLDYDGQRIAGGLSPAMLNWDAGMRASVAGVDVAGPEGIDVRVSSPREAAEVAAQWFGRRIGDRAET